MREIIHLTRLQRERRAQKLISEKPKNKLEQYLKFAPLGYLFLIVFSYVGLNAYYSVFGVDILGHMSIQELLVSPLKSIHLVVLFCLMIIMSIIGIALESHFEKVIRHGMANTLKGLAYPIFIIFLLILLLIFILSMDAIEYGIENWKLYTIATCLFLTFSVFGYGIKSLHIELPKYFYPYKTQFYLVLVFAFLLTSNFLVNYLQAVDRNNKRTNRITRIHLGGNNSTFVSGIFLGETNSTIFILGDSLNHAKAYLKKDITLIEYPVRQKLKMKEQQPPGSNVDSVSVAKPDTPQSHSQDSLKKQLRP